MTHLSRHQLAKATVTFLGDKRTLMRAMRDHLREQGITDIHMIHDMGLALDRMRSHGPDVLVVDLDDTADEVARTIQSIRADKEFYQLPIIALTGHASKEVVLKAARMGATDVIVKPFPLKQLHERVLAALGRNEA